MNYATESQKKELVRRMKYGQLPRMRRSVWTELSSEDAERMLEIARGTAPMTYRSVSSEMKTRLLSCKSSFKLYAGDFKTLSEHECDSLQNLLIDEWSGSGVYIKNAQDASPEQRKLLKDLMSDGWLNAIEISAWINLNNLTAKKMIAAGILNKKNAKKVRHV